jgi:cell division protein FtsI (penicillin-binding protein 3)
LRLFAVFFGEMAERKKRPFQGRLALIIVLVTLWTGAILARLIYLQVVRHDYYAHLAAIGQVATRSVLAPRGVIYDSHMDELATSTTVSTVVADPGRLRNIRRTAQDLAPILDMDPDELVDRISDHGKKHYLPLKRRIDPVAESRIEALSTDGIFLIEESMRVYPNRELACHLLGFVNMNGDGGAGIELQYDKDLKGTPGEVSLDVDAHGRSFRGKVTRTPVQGRSLVLSIDKSLQYVAARELAAGVEKSSAAAGVAIIMESDTGRILALASTPEFNSNSYNEYTPDYWRNRAVSDIFEPGSTFKVVVATAALEAGLVRPGEIVDCQMGSITISGHIFHDHKRLGLLTFSQILELSSNVGAAKLGLRLGEARLHTALRNFGFGSRTGIDLPGEVIGLVRDWHRWSGLSIGAISFGQEIGVTSLQILTAINTIANGGYRVRPSIVDRVIDEKGELVRVHTPQRHRIVRPETAAVIRDAFEGVVLRGTGRMAALEGYRAAGKTGTAQKIVNGHYSNTKYMASFIGFAPMPNPKLTILVQIDEPKGAIYGGDVAAPVFQRIAQQALLLLRVPPDQSLPLPKFNPAVAAAAAEDYLPNATPIAPITALNTGEEGAKTDDETILVRVAPNTVTVPDFHGMPKRRALDRCLELGIQMQAQGSGVAIFQVPPAGTKIPVGDACQVTFARGSAASRLASPD